MRTLCNRWYSHIIHYYYVRLRLAGRTLRHYYDIYLSLFGPSARDINPQEQATASQHQKSHLSAASIR